MNFGSVKKFFELVMIVIFAVFIKFPFLGIKWLFKNNFVRMFVVLVIIYVASIQFICLDLQNVLIWPVESRGYFTLGILIIIGLSYFESSFR